MTERSFHVSEKAEEADITEKEVKYLYNNRGEWWFANPENPGDRFKLDADMIGEKGKFLKANEVIEAMVFDEKIIGRLFKFHG